MSDIGFRMFRINETLAGGHCPETPREHTGGSSVSEDGSCGFNWEACAREGAGVPAEPPSVRQGSRWKGEHHWMGARDLGPGCFRCFRLRISDPPVPSTEMASALGVGSQASESWRSSLRAQGTGHRAQVGFELDSPPFILQPLSLLPLADVRASEQVLPTGKPAVTRQLYRATASL